MSPRIHGLRERRPTPAAAPTAEQLRHMAQLVARGFILGKTLRTPPWRVRAVRWLVRLFRRREKLPMLPRATGLIDRLGKR